MNCSLFLHPRGYEISGQDILQPCLTLGTALPYARRHWELAAITESRAQSLAHRGLAAIQIIPLVGLLAALIERIAAKIYLYYLASSSLPVSPQSNTKLTLIEQDTIPSWLHGDGIFNKFTCPITLEPIRHPIGDPNRRGIYEKAAIFQWLEQHSTSPITRLPLSKEQLIRLPAIQSLIDTRLMLIQKLIDERIKHLTDTHRPENIQ